MRTLGTLMLSAVLVTTTAMPMVAQRDRHDDDRNNRSSQYNDGLRRGYNGQNGGYNDQYDRQRYSRRNGQQYNNGQYNNGQYNNGQYNRGQYNNGQYNRGYTSQDEYNRTHGGIGPGKGAAIGGAGGAVLGALFGGGLKGAIIGGAAGAGVGAVAGKVHQNNQQRDWRDYGNGR